MERGRRGRGILGPVVGSRARRRDPRGGARGGASAGAASGSGFAETYRPRRSSEAPGCAGERRPFLRAASGGRSFESVLAVPVRPAPGLRGGCGAGARRGCWGAPSCWRPLPPAITPAKVRGGRSGQMVGAGPGRGACSAASGHLPCTLRLLSAALMGCPSAGRGWSGRGSRDGTGC